jgi:SSS family solute:Na+ symporter
MCLAPLLLGQESIFSYLQKMNGLYFIPILAVVLVGMLTRRVPPIAAKAALVTGFLVIACGYFVPPAALIVASMNDFHFLGVVFTYLVVMMLIIGEIWPLQDEWVQTDVRAVDMTPWVHARKAGLILLLLVLAIYITFADLSVLS